MTAPAYPAQPVYPQTRMSKSALLSLICGILGCVPFATGALALLLGIIGFVKTGKPGVTGRWMAVLGSLLGLASLVIWTLFFGSITALIFGVIAATQPPVDATNTFLRELSAGNTASAKVVAPDFSDEKLGEIEAYLKTKGTFKDTTFPVRNVQNNDATIEGVAEFSGGTENVRATLEHKGGKWEIQTINIRPSK